MTAGLILQVLVSGLAAGAAYGLIAIGFGLVYRLTSVLHFAHGELAGAAAFVALYLAAGASTVTQATVSPWHFRLAVLVAVLVVAAASALMYRVIIRPFLRDGSLLGWIGATVALALAIEGVLAFAFPREAYVLPDVLGGHGVIALGGGAVLPIRTIAVLLIALALGLGTGRLLALSKYGKALSAIADEPIGAQTTGLPVEPLVASAFALAGALAAVAGALALPAGGAISPQTGAIFGLKGFAAALLARLRSPERILIWALALGVVEAAIVSLHVPGFPSLALGPAWKDVGPFLIVLGMLALRPRGAGVERSE
ncbi:MAG: hypothetical protein NVSMB57_10500 [Actinomycetota bacterium]